jgi:hypothetical protein
MSVKRHDLCDHDGIFMTEMDDGRYVLFEDYEKEVHRLRKALEERDKETCEWKEDGDIANSQCGSWSTAWDINHKHCQFCGKRITRKGGVG